MLGPAIPFVLLDKKSAGEESTNQQSPPEGRMGGNHRESVGESEDRTAKTDLVEGRPLCVTRCSLMTPQERTRSFPSHMS